MEDFFPYTQSRAAEHNRLKEEEGNEEESDAENYYFGMDLDDANMPRVVEFAPIPIVIYPPFLDEEEVGEMEEGGDDGPYATKMREAISGACD